jgi:hypothetical protein
VTDEEVGTVEQGVRELAKLPYFLVDVQGPSIVVHLPPSGAVACLKELATPWLRQDPAELHRRMQKCLSYSPMMRFTLADEQTRQFAVDRWCFLGSIDDWFPLTAGGDLKRLVAKYCPHLGRDSFYELM